MTIPNILTMGRVILVPVIVWALLAGKPMTAFALFCAAGLSDAVDGILARLLNQHSELGAWLDPIADKAMLVSVFVVLGILGFLPLWLTILVVFRDLLIVVGVMLTFALGYQIEMKPLAVSKANTAAQIALAGFVLGILAFELEMPMTQQALEILTGILTVASAIAYITQGLVLLSDDGRTS
ncbi:MAG: CDP-alcohol phosphatidyltransferase family protein [Pseudomonadota bacterium]